MSRRLLPLLLLAGLLAAGCGGDSAHARPKITFTAGGHTVELSPTNYCSAQITDCVQGNGTPATLTVPAGAPVRITVPEAVSATPWQAVFTYEDAERKAVDARSPVFPPNGMIDYTLTVPDSGTLTHLEVQQYGAALAPGPDGPEFIIRGVWVPKIERAPR